MAVFKGEAEMRLPTMENNYSSLGIERVPELVCRIDEVVRELEALFPGRKFTPDEDLVGSLGEVIAANHYGLELLPNSLEGHDAISSSGLMVQIKATQGQSVALRSEPEHLLVLKIHPDGSFSEIYNGLGNFPWKNVQDAKEWTEEYKSKKLVQFMNLVDGGNQLSLR